MDFYLGCLQKQPRKRVNSSRSSSLRNATLHSRFYPKSATCRVQGSALLAQSTRRMTVLDVSKQPRPAEKGNGVPRWRFHLVASSSIRGRVGFANPIRRPPGQVGLIAMLPVTPSERALGPGCVLPLGSGRAPNPRRALAAAADSCSAPPVHLREARATLGQTPAASARVFSALLRSCCGSRRRKPTDLKQLVFLGDRQGLDWDVFSPPRSHSFALCDRGLFWVRLATVPLAIWLCTRRVLE